MTISRWEKAVGASRRSCSRRSSGRHRAQTAKVTRRRRRIRTPSRRSPATPRRTSSRRGSSRARSRRARSRSRTGRPRSRSTATTATARWFRRRATCRPPGHNVEASKSEPDKNTYLVLHRPGRPRPELRLRPALHLPGPRARHRATSRAINLDADDAHRITLWATEDSQRRIRCRPSTARRGTRGRSASSFTAENGANGGVWQSTLDFPPLVEEISGILGRGGYEGIQNDSDGNLWIAEDVSGAKGAVNNHARQPNSFIFRFLPNDKHDLTKGGKLQALQVCRLNVDALRPDRLSRQRRRRRHPVAEPEGPPHLRQPVQDELDHRPRHRRRRNRRPSTPTRSPRRITRRRSSGPRTAQFRPGKQFKEFFFDATGDTDAATQAGSAVRRLRRRLQADAIEPVRRQRRPHALLPRRHRPHGPRQRRVLGQGPRRRSSRTAATVCTPRTMPSTPPGSSTCGPTTRTRTTSPSASSRSAATRPPRSTPRSRRARRATVSRTRATTRSPGIHVSDGDPGIHGILGDREPHPFHGGWRIFYTQQHGDNFTWEILPAGSGPSWLPADGD